MQKTVSVQVHVSWVEQKQLQVPVDEESTIKNLKENIHSLLNKIEFNSLKIVCKGAVPQDDAPVKESSYHLFATSKGNEQEILKHQIKQQNEAPQVVVEDEFQERPPNQFTLLLKLAFFLYLLTQGASTSRQIFLYGLATLIFLVQGGYMRLSIPMFNVGNDTNSYVLLLVRFIGSLIPTE